MSGDDRPAVDIDVLDHNERAWSAKVEEGNEWTVPVDGVELERARRGEVRLLTPTLAPPRAWFPDELAGKRVLALAAGGGQQGPVLAAMGAEVTVVDASAGQLGQDRAVAEREGLALEIVQGDMADLSRFADASFDLIVHPVSNCFAPDVLPVWREARRVLAPGGRLLAGVCNPLMYLFDEEETSREGVLTVRNALPYADTEQMSAEQLAEHVASGEALEFGHSLTDQLGGQLAAGFLIAGLYEDIHPGTALAPYAPVFLVTCAVVPPFDGIDLAAIAGARPTRY